jgi:hypothetical protein
MRRRIPSWLGAARRLHELKTKAGEPCACRPTFHAHELLSRLAGIEQCYQLKLPPSYREFLLRYDGWPFVFRGASLLSCDQLLNPGLIHSAEVVLERANTPVPAVVTQSGLSWRDDALMPIGMDDSGEILFALDASTAKCTGEMDMLVWIAELGIRLSSFGELFDLLCDLTETSVATGSARTAAAA